MQELQTRLDEAIAILGELEGSLDEVSGEVRRDVHGDTVRILLDSPRVHNALSARMMRQLGQAVRDQVESPPAVLVLASAHGGSFCAGGHLGQVRAGLLDRRAARAMSVAMTTVLNAISRLPSLSIAVVEGPAVGGGVELATSCDLCVSTVDGSFDPAQLRLGVTPGWGGARRLVRRLGAGRSLAFLGRSRRIDARAALELGLIDDIVPGPIEVAIQRGLGAAAHQRPEVVHALKRQVLSDQGHDESELFLSVWGGPAHRKALGLEP